MNEDLKQKETKKVDCWVCGKVGPMVFADQIWCSDDHRKVIQGEKEPTWQEAAEMDPALLRELRENGTVG
jgi:hypothetical protein